MVKRNYLFIGWGLALGVIAPAFLTLSAAGCAEPLFAPAAVKDLNPALQMGIFNPEADTYFKGHLAQVGGRIVAIEQRTGRQATGPI